MTTPDSAAEQPDPAAQDAAAGDQAARQPSLAPGVVLLVLAAVLIVVTLIKPDLPRWLTVSVAVAAVLVVIALLIYAFRVFRDVTRPGGPR